MLDKLQALREKYIHLEEQLSDPGIVADMDKSKKVNKEYKKLQPIIQAADQYEKVLSNIDSARAMLATETDPEMRDMAREEIVPASTAALGPRPAPVRRHIACPGHGSALDTKSTTDIATMGVALQAMQGSAAWTKGKKYGLPLAYDEKTDRQSWEDMKAFWTRVMR